ncbi:MAG: DEAD/DEAH box helicase, partial [Rhodobacteraceae bacterium]|nr:DEAD/DEAH box helicase [Paracoccaceae bacterium]
GFIPDIERIFQLTPFTRQTLFFSATMAPEIERITNMFLSNPARVEVARQATTAETIEQQLIELTPTRRDRAFSEKRAMLRALIASEGDACTNAIIFCNRKIDVDVVAKSLKKHGFDASPIHGDLDQSVRTRTLDGFRDGTVRLLVASDVAARGLDIPAVSHVFNFDVPSHSEDYVHRIGRTGRAGRKGKAFTISTPSDDKYLAAIEHLLQRQLPRGVAPEGFAEAAAEAASRPERTERPARGDRKRGERSERGERGDRGERGSRRREKPVETPAIEAAEVAVVAVVEAAPVEAPAPQRDEARDDRQNDRQNDRRDDKRDDKRGRGRRERGPRDDQPVVGMGDHVPDFLMREFRAKAG